MSDDPRHTNYPSAAGDPLAPRPLAEGAIAPEVSRRVSSILDAVEREAGQLRDDAREEARRYLESSRRRADSLVAERQRRIAELSNEIVGKAEAVVGRLDDAAPVREGFDNLVRALGEAAESLSREAESTRPEFDLPGFHEIEAADPYPAPDPGSTYAAPPAPPPPFSPPIYEGTNAEPMARDPLPAAHYEQAPARPPEEPQPHPARAPVFDQQPPAAAPRPAAPPPAAPGPEPAPPMRPQEATEWRGIDDVKLISIQMAAAGQTRHQIRDHLYHAMGVTDSGAVLDEIFGVGSAEDARVPWTTFPR